MKFISVLYCRTYQKILKTAAYLLPWRTPQIIEGEDCFDKLVQILESQHLDNVLLVTGNTIRSLGLPDKLLEALDTHHIACTVFSDIQANPSIENVENTRKAYLDNNCQAVIAFGGGSPMDCAKVAAARVTNPQKSVSDMRGQLKVTHPLPPFFAVPTTAGTGSETTIAAVITNTQTHEKYAVNDIKLIPTYAVLDARLTTALPKHVTSTTGMDALTHALEAYIGNSNTAETKAYAEKAVKMIFENVLTAYHDGENLEARRQMLKASFYAGIAFTRAYVGYVHAIAHQLGGIYNIPHGLANAVILPHVLEYYGDSIYEKLSHLADLVQITSKSQTTQEKALLFISEIKRLNREMAVPEQFDMIKESDIPTIVQRALKEGNPLYPVPKIMDTSDCEQLIRRLMKSAN